MQLITRKTLAKEAASKWKSTYHNVKYWHYDWYDETKKEIYNKLAALGENPIPEQVDDVIGNPFWTNIICVDCKKSVNQAIVFTNGDETHHICKTCLYKSIKLFKGQKDA